MNLSQSDWVAKWAIYSPNKIAFKEWESKRELSFSELNQKANQLAFFFQSKYNLKKGDRVVVLAENCLEYIILFSVAQKMGIILVPLNYRLTKTEIDFLLQDADPQLIIYERKFRTLISATDTTKEFTQCVPYLLLEQISESGINSEYANLQFSSVCLEADDAVFILYTSGTTGFPKGALYTHGMLFWNSINTSLSLILNTESRTLNVMPPFHTGGWNVLTTPFLHHGGYTCILKKFDAKVVLDLLEIEKVSIFMGVPTMLKMMAELPEFETTNFQQLLYIIVGGEAMSIPLIEKWHKRNVPIRQGFGMTEVGPNLTSLHQNDAVRKKGSIGKANYYVNIKIVNDENKEVGVNETGELLFQGPMTTPGYWQNPIATQKSIQKGWFYSGDLARRDEEGYFYIVDRIKNMFISGGENIYPAEIERVIMELDSVSEAVVIGVSDPKWGEVGKAFLVANKGSVLNERDLLAYCKSKLAKFKVPKQFVFVDELPKNDTGKIKRKALK